MAISHDKKALVYKTKVKLVEKYKYTALPAELSVEKRVFFKENLPKGFLEQGDDCPLFSSEGTLLCEKYNRIVIGDYGAFVEILPEDMVLENIKIKAGQEYRVNDEKYAKNVKYIWYTTKDGANVNIYRQKKFVRFADYVPGRYYICPFECFVEEPFESWNSVLSVLQKSGSDVYSFLTDTSACRVNNTVLIKDGLSRLLGPFFNFGSSYVDEILDAITEVSGKKYAVELYGGCHTGKWK